MTNKTTFWNFIKAYEIEIPIIQRDYAQGRLGKENLRKNFLGDLKKALDDKEELTLDFIFGSNENNKLNPLDGQQRLTTLWLLHWYIALQAGELNEENCEIFKKFKYETRISSRDFCQNLCKPKYFEKFKDENNEEKDVVGFITKQTWFFSAWKQDPTIQSMLRMLGGTKIADKKGEDIIDGIEELFLNIDTESFKLYWKELTEKETIVFYYLPPDSFGNSDDLYIKMNARGKQLTSFENFKADLIGYMKKQAEDNTLNDEQRDKWELLLDPNEGIPIKLDTLWTDIFWKNKSIGIKKNNTGEIVKSEQIDDIFFAFFNRLFWNELFSAKKSDKDYVLDIGKGDESSTKENENVSYRYLNDSQNSNDYDTKIAYQELDVYKYHNGIPVEFFIKLRNILNNYSKYIENYKFPECPWNRDFKFIPEYIKENSHNVEITNNSNEKILKVSTLNQVQRVVFFAVCKYFDHENGIEDKEESLKRWLRVVWNLVSGEDQNGNSQIRSTQAMRTAIEFISELNSHDVYQSLIDYDTQNLKTSDFHDRCKEEIQKAIQINNEEERKDGKKWEEIINKAERFAFFKGAIRFLYLDENGNIKWEDFETKWQYALKYFNEDGIKDDGPNGINYKSEAILLKAVLFHVENFEKYIEPEKFVFDNNANTWKKNILLDDNWKKAVNEILKGHIEVRIRQNDCLMYKQLYSSDLLNYVANNQPRSRIKWIHDRRALYPPYREGIMLDDDKENSQFYRNCILIELIKEKKITSDQKIKDCSFFKGWDINFKFQDHNFLWHSNNHVYLMGKNEPTKYITRDESKSEKLEQYICFEASAINDKVEFVEKLDNLIEEWNNKKENKD